MAKPVVGILMGSDSDLPIMQETGVMLREFGIEYEMTIASAHHTPKKVLEYSQSAERRGPAPFGIDRGKHVGAPRQLEHFPPTWN